MHRGHRICLKILMLVYGPGEIGGNRKVCHRFSVAADDSLQYDFSGYG